MWISSLFYHPVPQYHEKLLQVLTFILAISALEKLVSSGNGITSAQCILFVNALNDAALRIGLYVVVRGNLPPTWDCCSWLLSTYWITEGPSFLFHDSLIFLRTVGIYLVKSSWESWYIIATRLPLPTCSSLPTYSLVPQNHKIICEAWLLLQSLLLSYFYCLYLSVF